LCEADSTWVRLELRWHAATRECAGTERSDKFNEAIARERGIVRFGVGGRAHEKYPMRISAAMHGDLRDGVHARSAADDDERAGHRAGTADSSVEDYSRSGPIHGDHVRLQDGSWAAAVVRLASAANALLMSSAGMPEKLMVGWAMSRHVGAELGAKISVDLDGSTAAAAAISAHAKFSEHWRPKGV
jgi:hypothetical protein